MRSKQTVVGIVASLPPVVVLVDGEGSVSRRPLSFFAFQKLRRRHPELSSDEPSRCQLNRARNAGGRPGKCKSTGRIAQATEEVLGSAASPRSCALVSPKKMDRILRQHNWDSGEGVVGFHTPEDDLYVTKQWSVPHEWVHAAGLVDDHLAMWVCEGLTEVVAEQVARRAKVPYQGTYTYERQLVEESLAPALGMPPLDLARQVVQWYGEGKSPAARMAHLLGDRKLRPMLDRDTGDQPSDRLLKVLGRRGRANIRLQKKTARP